MSLKSSASLVKAAFFVYFCPDGEILQWHWSYKLASESRQNTENS